MGRDGTRRRFLARARLSTPLQPNQSHMAETSKHFGIEHTSDNNDDSNLVNGNDNDK